MVAETLVRTAWAWMGATRPISTVIAARLASAAGRGSGLRECSRYRVTRRE